MPFFGHLLWCYSGASVFLASMPHLWFMYHAMLRMLYDLIMYICDYIYAHYYYTCLVHICCRYCRHHVVLVAKTQQLCWHAQQLWDNAQCSNQKCKHEYHECFAMMWCVKSPVTRVRHVVVGTQGCHFGTVHYYRLISQGLHRPWSYRAWKLQWVNKQLGSTNENSGWQLFLWDST